MISDPPTKVLVSGASGIVGYGILKCLRQAPLPLQLIGTSIYSDSVASAFCDQFELAPPTDDPGYPDWLLHISRKHGAKVLFPGIEADIYRWNTFRERLSAEGFLAVLNTPELLECTRDKWRFYEELELMDCPYRIPSSLDSEWESASRTLGAPLLLKPRQGYASKGILRVDSQTQWEGHRHRIGAELMVQRIIGRSDAEFTVSGFGDGSGHVTALIALRRELSSEGFTLKAESCSSEPFRRVIENLSAHFRPLGPTNFQFRMEDSQPYLLEINPRISSSVSIRCALGYNEPLMALEQVQHGTIPAQPVLRSGRAIRYWEDYVLLDEAQS
jgi:carbamoyl-phosphate synthase large subunit